uniref:Signal peptidase complex subunit 3 n=1 Tax=Trepomonas sp. PC1 TaxID=1076344 RepID=A0A146K4L9_9EUKA|eukprot:JAP90815.1 Signal peptidase subunit [Trepomonas sp. PC1]
MFTIFIVMIIIPYFIANLNTTPKLSLNNITNSQIKRISEKQQIRAHDECDLFINISYDLSNTFKWYTKELYISLVAIWENEVGKQEQTIWDKTIFHEDKASFSWQGYTKSKYPLTTYEGSKILGSDLSFKYIIHEVGFGGRFRQWDFDQEQTYKVI